MGFLQKKYGINYTGSIKLRSKQIRHLSTSKCYQADSNSNSLAQLKQEKKELYHNYQQEKNLLSKKEQNLEGEMLELITQCNKTADYQSRYDNQSLKLEIIETKKYSKDIREELTEIEKQSNTHYTESTSSRSSFESLDLATERKILDIKTEYVETISDTKHNMSDIISKSCNLPDITKRNINSVAENVNAQVDSYETAIEKQDSNLGNYEQKKQEYENEKNRSNSNESLSSSTESIATTVGNLGIQGVSVAENLLSNIDPSSTGLF